MDLASDLYKYSEWFGDCSLRDAMFFLMHIFKEHASQDGENQTLSKGELADLLRKGNFLT